MTSSRIDEIERFRFIFYNVFVTIKHAHTKIRNTKMKRQSTELRQRIEISAGDTVFLNDDVLIHVAKFIEDKKDWWAFMLVSKQFLRCGREGFDFTKYASEAMILASRKGYVGSLSFFLSHPKVDLPKGAEFAIVSDAFQYGHPEIVALMLSRTNVDPSDYDNFIIGVASAKGYLKVVEILLSHPKVDPSDMDNFAIKCASGRGQHEVVALLLTHPKVDPSAQHNLALRWASRNGHRKVVALLLSHPNVDPSDLDNFSIRCASRFEYHEIVALLLSHPKVDPSAKNGYPIMWIPDPHSHDRGMRSFDELVKQRSDVESDPRVVDILLDHPKNEPPVDRHYALRLAFTGGDSLGFMCLGGSN